MNLLQEASSMLDNLSDAPEKGRTTQTIPSLQQRLLFISSTKKRHLSRMIGFSPAEEDTLTPTDDVQWMTRTIRYCK